MTRFDYDLFTIGAGSGGVRASRMAGQFGARVAIAEHDRIGGTCVIRGCVPKKLLSYAAHYAEDLEDARGYGWTVEGASFSWPALIESKNREIARLSGVYADALAGAGVAVIEGTAKLLDAHTVAIDGRRVTAQNVLVATGGWPGKPAIPGIEHAITSTEAFELPALPRRVLMVGGGYVAAEVAGIFNGLGAEGTLCYRGEQILRGLDDDVRRHPPHRAHAGGDPRGRGRGDHALRWKRNAGGPRRRAERRVQPAAGRHGRAHRVSGGGETRQGRHLQGELPAAAAHALGPRRAHADEARRRRRHPARGRRAHGGRGRAGNHPGHRHRGEGRPHQGAVRCHGGNPSHGGGGVRDAAGKNRGQVNGNREGARLATKQLWS